MKTGWYLQRTFDRLNNETTLGSSFANLVRPEPLDLAYHSIVPFEDNQKAVGEMKLEYDDGKDWYQKIQEVPTGTFTHCHYTGGKCYSRELTSFVNMRELLETLLRDGIDKMWEELERYYKITFSVLPTFVSLQDE